MTCVNGCASVEKVITITESNCSIVPHIIITDEQFEQMYLDELFRPILIDIDRQSRIIDLCK